MNQITGTGRKIYVNGDYYKGSFLNGLPDGKGLLVEITGRKFEGEWRSGYQHGYCVEVWGNGEGKYEGEFVEGRRQGKGRLELADGSYYEGEFEDGLFHGQGLYFFKDSGKTYEGSFVKGKI